MCCVCVLSVCLHACTSVCHELCLCVDAPVKLPVALIALLFPYKCKLSVIKLYARRKRLVKDY